MPKLTSAARRPPIAALLAGGLLLAGCSGGEDSSLTDADRAACDTLHQYGDNAIDGQPSAVQALEDQLGGAGKDEDPFSDDLSPYAQLVAASALLIDTGAEAPELPKYVGQMQGVCQTLGWRSGS